jgi:hypothetical protein
MKERLEAALPAAAAGPPPILTPMGRAGSAPSSATGTTAATVAENGRLPGGVRLQDDRTQRVQPRRPALAVGAARQRPCDRWSSCLASADAWPDGEDAAHRRARQGDNLSACCTLWVLQHYSALAAQAEMAAEVTLMLPQHALFDAWAQQLSKNATFL